MPRFEPFHGIRYDASRLDPRDVTAPPYDVISPVDRAALVDRAPTNVVRIDLPVDGTDPYGEAAELFAAWRADGTLIDDPEPSFTVYRMEAPDEDGVIRRTTKKVEAPKPMEELRSDSSTADGLKSVKRKETKTEEPTPAEEKQPKDSDSTGKPRIDAQKPADPTLNPPEGTKPAKPSEKAKAGDKAA